MTLIDVPRMDKPGPQGTESVAAADAAPLLGPALAGLELPVQFELAGPALSLAAIAALSVDDVLELPMPADQVRVRMNVSGACVCHGELVSLGGRLAVRIVRTDLQTLGGSMA